VYDVLLQGLAVDEQVEIAVGTGPGQVSRLHENGVGVKTPRCRRDRPRWLDAGARVTNCGYERALPFAIVAADLDGDGDQDLAVANIASDNVTILRNNGSGKFAQPASSPVAVGNGPFAIVAADLDGDGDQDLAVANLISANVTILIHRQ
jgi:hypothetical protein